MQKEHCGQKLEESNLKGISFTDKEVFENMEGVIEKVGGFREI